MDIYVPPKSHIEHKLVIYWMLIFLSLQANFSIKNTFKNLSKGKKVVSNISLHYAFGHMFLKVQLYLRNWMYDAKIRMGYHVPDVIKRVV